MRIARLLLSCCLSAAVTLTPAFEASAQTKATPKPATKRKATKRLGGTVPDDKLGVLTMEQVARLSHAKRVQYIALIRQTALELDKLQRLVKKGRFKSAALDQGDSASDYAAEAARLLLGERAFAASKCDEWENACIDAGNLSSYPREMGGDQHRVPFQCIMTPCNYGRSIRGVKCNFGYSGLINEPDMGCLPIEKTTNAINRAFASKACWERREKLLGRKLIVDDGSGNITRINQITDPARQQMIDKEVQDLIQQSNAYFGFNGGTFYRDDFQTETAKNFLTKLTKLAYHDAAYAQLIRIAYFYKSNNQNFPPGTQSMETGEHTSLSKIGSLHALEQNFNNLNTAVDEIFSALRYHCGKIPCDSSGRVKTLPESEVAKIRSGENLSRVSPGTSAYILEKERQQHLENLPPGTPVTHGNVLEKRECELIELRFQDVKRQIQEITVTYPDVVNGPRPLPVPPPPPEAPDDRVTIVEPTGCTENVSRELDNIVQPAARCMACLIQGHEARKAKLKNPNDPYAGTYVPSKKYLSLVSTMALACGDGLVNNASLSGKAMVEYLMDFAHCSSHLYEFTGNESDQDKKLVQEWNSEGFINECEDSRRDRRAALPKNNPTHPDHNNHFLKIYGMKFETAQKLFCPEDRLETKGRLCRKAGTAKPREQWTNHDRESIQKARRERFYQALTLIERGEKGSVADNLLSCLKEARTNSKAFSSGQNMCYSVQSARGYSPQIFNNNSNTNASQPDLFLDDPPVLFDGHYCMIPKQKEIYPYYMENGREVLCVDRNKDNIDDNTRRRCEGKRYSYLWVDPAQAADDYTKYSSKTGGDAGLKGDYQLYSDQPDPNFANYELTRLSDRNCPLPADAVEEQPITTRRKRGRRDR